MKNILIKTARRKNYLDICDLENKIKFTDKTVFSSIDSESIEFYIDDEKVIIKEIKLTEHKQKAEEKRFKIKNNSLTIVFKSPTIFKVGYNFLDFSVSLLFLLSAKKYNKYFKDNKIILDKEELKKINVVEENLEKAEFNSFMGEVKLDFSNISDEEKEKYEHILNFILKNGVAYKQKKHYGRINLI